MENEWAMNGQKMKAIYLGIYYGSYEPRTKPALEHQKEPVLL